MGLRHLFSRKRMEFYNAWTELGLPLSPSYKMLDQWQLDNKKYGVPALEWLRFIRDDVERQQRDAVVEWSGVST